MYSIERTVLPNGLTVMTSTVPTTTATVSLTFPVGSAADGEKSGIAHFLEHTLVHPKSLMAVYVRGAECDFSTDQVSTQYVLHGNAKDVKELIRALAEAVFAKKLNRRLVETERGAILNEIAQVKNEDAVTSWIKRTLYPDAMEIHAPICGTVASVNSILYDDLVEFRERWYSSHGALLVVVGSIEHKQVVRWALNAPFPRLDQPSRTWRGVRYSPTQTRATYKEAVSNSISAYFQIPSVDELTVHADVACAILTAYPFGLMPKCLRFIDGKLYTASYELGGSTWSDVYIDLDVTPRGARFAEKRLKECLSKLITCKYDPAIFDACKARLVRSGVAIRELNDPIVCADWIANEWLGGGDEPNDLLDIYASITQEEVTAFAEQYLHPDAYSLLHFKR